ncbi:MAG TPA: YtxH domain-containing protein [Puia sp.]|nr:YtxH domain-containing protein [Puia sp.]
MKSESKVLLAVAAGVAAGAALGVAFAPEKGSETRKKWKEDLKKFNKQTNGACRKDKLVKAKAKLEQVLEKINGKIESYEKQETNIA